MERSQGSRSLVRSLAGYRIQVVHPTLHTQVASTVSRVGSQVSTVVSRVGTVVSRVASTQVGSLDSRRLVRKVATPEANRAVTLAVSRRLVSREAEARGAPRDPVRSTEQSTVVHGRLKGLRLRKLVMVQHLSNLDTVVRHSRLATGVLLSTRASRTQDRAASPGTVPRRSSLDTVARRKQVASVVPTQVCLCRRPSARRLRGPRNLRRREQASLGR